MHKIANSKLFIEQDDSTIVNLKLQLDYDKVSKPAFFNIIIKAYLERDPRILSLLEENNKKPRSKEKVEKDEKEFRQTEKEFGLNENDIENIFDIISKENSDL